MSDDKTARIRTLNDRCRRHFLGCRVMMTPGVQALSDAQRARLFTAVKTFDQFSEDNDPHGEHDFGAVEIDGDRFFWKWDYYDAAMEYGSEDPSDPQKTTRVLTIMLAEEY